MAKLFFNSDGEPRIVEQQLSTRCRISKLHNRVLHPRLSLEKTSITLFVEPDFNALLPVNHRISIPTGLTFHFEKGFIGNIYSLPNHIAYQGIYVVSQIVNSDCPLNLTVLNFGDMDRAIFAEMAIAQLVITPAPIISLAFDDDIPGQ